MGWKHRVRVEFDVEVDDQDIPDAIEVLERWFDSFRRAQEGPEGFTIVGTGASPDVAFRTMLDNPKQRASLAAIALLSLGQQAAQNRIKVRSFEAKPLDE